MPANKIRLEICGCNYVISSTDSEQYVLDLAARLDRDMNLMLAETPNASVTSAAIITALGYLDELEKSTSGADNMRAQIRDYLEDASKAKMAAEEARHEVERLRRELGYLKENKA
ncbi:MAG: cell division protein ZapA [Oscillospiraceae bacterium]